MYATKRYPPIIPKVSNIAWVLLNPIISNGRLQKKTTPKIWKFPYLVILYVFTIVLLKCVLRYF